MDKERDVVNHQIEQTRRELSDQLAELALRVDETQTRARNAIRPRYWYERKPWLVIAGSIALGYGVERSLMRGHKRRKFERDSVRLGPSGNGEAHREILSRLDALDGHIEKRLSSIQARAGAAERRYAHDAGALPERRRAIPRDDERRHDEPERGETDAMGDIARAALVGIAHAVFGKLGSEVIGNIERRRTTRRAAERAPEREYERGEDEPYSYERPWLR